MIRVFNKIRIVVFLIPTKVDLLQQTALGEKRQGAVKSGAGGGGINFTCHFPQIFSSKMAGGTERGGDNDITLTRATQAFFFDEVLEALKNIRVNSSGRCFQSLVGCGQSMSYRIQFTAVSRGRSMVE